MVDTHVERLVGDLPQYGAGRLIHRISVPSPIKPCLGASTPNPGVSIPAVTTKFERTKHDMRSGRKTGCPVSGRSLKMARELGFVQNGPGCRVESTIFFACHSSGVIDLSCPCLYDDMSFLAFSRPTEETKSVLISTMSSN